MSDAQAGLGTVICMTRLATRLRALSPPARPSSITTMNKLTTHQRGIGLLEVLLAVVLLSIGFLATARMQVEGMRFSQSAYALSQAKFMVLDMTERMRANRSGLQGTVYRGKSTQPGTSNPACITAGSPCSPADIASADLHAWSQNLHASGNSSTFTPLLPSSANIPAMGTITYDDAEGSYSVSVQWSEVADGVDTRQLLTVKVFP